MLKLTDFPGLMLPVSDQPKEIICSHSSPDGNKFAVATLASGKVLAVWNAHNIICDTIDDLVAHHLNQFEKNLLALKHRG